MSLETMPGAILAKHPELTNIFEALSAYHQGRSITARCPKCGQLLVVTDVPAAGARWVTCESGCTSYREKLLKHAEPFVLINPNVIFDKSIKITAAGSEKVKDLFHRLAVA